MVITEYLKVEEVDGERWVSCRKCNSRICKANDNYKESCLSLDSRLGDSNLLIEDSLVPKFIDDAVVYRQFFCPNCGINIENEICKKADTPFHDIQIDLG